MSSTTNRSPNFPDSTSESSASEASLVEKPTMLLKPPARPKLVAPPQRPEVEPEKPSDPQPSQSPTSDQETPAKEVSIQEALTSKADDAAIQPDLPRQQPISPPSEPMQYRAIGLVRGHYQPSEEQFNRGNLVTEDEVPINAVLLGRVTSLIKKHLDLSKPHLWVVYPRTRDKTENAEIDLHVQIVGVWEPETLNQPDQPADQAEPEAGIADSEATTTAKPEAVKAESEAAIAESEATTAEPEAAITETEESVAEPETVIAESETTIAEAEEAAAEPEMAAVESETATTELTETTAEPEIATVESEATIAELENANEAAVLPETKAASEATILSKAESPASITQAKDSEDPGEVNGSKLLIPDDYFSIRGEVINYSEEAKQIVIKILQGAKKPSDDAKSFKLIVRGLLTGKTIGYFWDLEVQRQSRSLVLQSATPIGAVPPKKRVKKKAGSRGGPSGGRNQRPKPRRGAKTTPTANHLPVVKKLDKVQRSDG
ncbi:MAG: hypothetical protein QNJ46_30010 [Leptolyngbyaceae cyanobacterium MO_188.B28]|nr:hypothetical protein [Leptolyngbyaceae cyanobacterium MO_188.B28]